MSATAPLARSLTLAGALIVAGATPVLAADRADRSLPKVDFTLAASVPYVPSVVTAPPPSLLREDTVEPSPSPIVEAAQTRPVDLGVARTGGDAATQ